MTWTQDYCTVCDKQCPQGSVYCSDNCRLFEERATGQYVPEQIHNLVYSSLYTTGKHISLSSPRCDCVGLECFCGANDHSEHFESSCGSASSSSANGHKEFLYNSPLLGPTTRSSRRGSISSSYGNHYSTSYSHHPMSPPPSPLMIPASTTYGLKKSKGSGHHGPHTPGEVSPSPSDDYLAPHLSRTSANYRRWLSAA